MNHPSFFSSFSWRTEKTLSLLLLISMPSSSDTAAHTQDRTHTTSPFSLEVCFPFGGPSSSPPLPRHFGSILMRRREERCVCGVLDSWKKQFPSVRLSVLPTPSSSSSSPFDFSPDSLGKRFSFFCRWSIVYSEMHEFGFLQYFERGRSLPGFVFRGKGFEMKG